MGPKKKAAGKKERGGGTVRAPKKKGCCQAVVSQIFADSQRSKATHNRLAAQLDALKGGTGFVGFVTTALQYALISPIIAAVDRVFSLIGTLLKTQKEHTIAAKLLQFAIPHLKAEDKNVRRNACELIRVVMQHYEPGEEDTVLDNVVEGLHDALDDKVLSVRAKAIEAMHRVQDPSWGARCDVSQHLLQMLCQDAAVERLEVLKRLEQQEIVPQLLCCAIDSTITVRRAAYKRLAQLSPQCFSLGQRGALLQRGLTERAPDIRAMTRSILKNWLTFYKDSPPLVLRALDETNETLCKLVAEALFEVRYRKPDGISGGQALEMWDRAESESLVSDDPSPESLLMLRVVIERLSEEGSDRRDIYLPEMNVASSLLTLLMETLDNALRASVQSSDELRRLLSVMNHLLQICLLYEPDLHTEEQRGQMLQAVFQLAPVLIVDNPTSLVSPSVQVLKHFWRGRDEDLRRCMVLILSTLYETMTTSARTADDEMTTTAVDFDAERQSRLDAEKQERIATLKEEARAQEDAVLKSKRRRDSAETIRDHQLVLDKLNNSIQDLFLEATYDSAVWIRMLEYIHHALSGRRGEVVSAGFQDLIEIARHCAMDHFNGFVRAKALCILTVAAVQNKDAASTYKTVFMKSLRMDTYPTPDLAVNAMQSALHGIVDVYLEHGARAFQVKAHTPIPVAFSDAPTQEIVTVPDETPKSVDDGAVLDVLLSFVAHGECSFDGEDVGFPIPEELGVDKRRRIMKATAVQGLAKLLACNRLPEGRESDAIVQLLLYNVDPLQRSCTESDGTAHALQTLSVFFTTYSFSSPQRQAMVAEAVKRAVRYISRDCYALEKDDHITPIEAQKVGRKEQVLNATVLSFFAHLTDAMELRNIKSNAGAKLSKETRVARSEASQHEALAQHILLEALVELEEGDTQLPKKFLKV